MSAHFTLTLDTAPPANPLLVLNGGEDWTAEQVVEVTLSTVSPDVREMLLWGDVDPAADARVQPLREASTWLLYDPEFWVRLADGAGVKALYAALRDDVCNEAPEVVAFITFEPDRPSVTLTTAPDGDRISDHDACAVSTFAWQSSRAFDAYEVRVVPDAGAAWGAGVVLGTASGSANVAGTGSFPAGTPIATRIHGADLKAAAPGDSSKTLKVFVRDAETGMWSR